MFLSRKKGSSDFGFGVGCFTNDSKIVCQKCLACPSKKLCPI